MLNSNKTQPDSKPMCIQKEYLAKSYKRLILPNISYFNIKSLMNKFSCDNTDFMAQKKQRESTDYTNLDIQI